MKSDSCESAQYFNVTAASLKLIFPSFETYLPDALLQSVVAENVSSFVKVIVNAFVSFGVIVFLSL